MGQIGTNFQFFPVPFSPCLHSFATVPPSSVDELARRTSQLTKWDFRDWPTLADFLASADGCQLVPSLCLCLGQIGPFILTGRASSFGWCFYHGHWWPTLTSNAISGLFCLLHRIVKWCGPVNDLEEDAATTTMVGGVVAPAYRSKYSARRNMHTIVAPVHTSEGEAVRQSKFFALASDSSSSSFGPVAPLQSKSWCMRELCAWAGATLPFWNSRTSQQARLLASLLHTIKVPMANIFIVGCTAKYFWLVVLSQ